jgi:hypothetical protein
VRSVALVVTLGIIVVCIAIGVAGARVNATQFLVEPPSVVSAVVGGVVAAVVGLLLGRRLPSRRGAHWSVPIGLGLVGIYGGAITPALANVALDGSEAVAHATVVRDRGEVEVSGRHGKRDEYFITVDPWAGIDGQPVRLWLPSKQVGALREGQAVHVHVRAGWLGYPWIERVAPGALDPSS